MVKPMSKDMLEESYDSPVIYPGSRNLSKTTSGGINFKRTEWNTTRFGPVNAKPSAKMKPCQKITAGALCEDDYDPDYPRETARKLSKNEQFKSFYSPYFTIYDDDVMTKQAGPEINTRLDSNLNNEGDPICAVEERYRFVKPIKLMDRNDDWRYILQQDSDNYTQVVQVEVCVNPNGPCQILSSLSAGYGCRCVQKFSYRKLVWITEDNKYGVDDFKVPSCCSCRYYMMDDDNGALRMTSRHSQNKSGG